MVSHVQSIAQVLFRPNVSDMFQCFEPEGKKIFEIASQMGLIQALGKPKTQITLLW